VLPFRLDYLVKIGTLKRLGGVRIGLEAIALSIISLGLVDAVAFLPLSISATATASSNFRLPLLAVVLFGVVCFGILFAGSRLQRIPIVRSSRRLTMIAQRVGSHSTLSRSTGIAGLFLLCCWTTRAVGSAALLAALGVSFSPTLALVVLCLGAAAGILPITSGGAVANIGATSGVLLMLGVHKEAAINFGLASGMMLAGTALIAGICGALMSLSFSFRRRVVAARVGV
jgi:hypothetical protein